MFQQHARQPHPAITALVYLWRCRLELLIAAALIGEYTVLRHLLGQPATGIISGLTPIVLVAIPRTRRIFDAALHTAVVRRRWARAVRDSGAHHLPSRSSRKPYSVFGPRVVAVKRVPTGDRLRVRLPRGMAVGDLERASGELAVCLRPCSEVKVLADPTKHAHMATVDIIRADPFASGEPLPWPHKETYEDKPFSIWDPVDLGKSEDADPVQVNLFETAWLVGGTIGSGKSGFLSEIIAHCALSPDCELWLMDGKDIEFPRWASAARIYVGKDRQAAISLLRELEETMQARYSELKRNGRLKVQKPETLQVLVVDELAEYLTYDNDDEYALASTILELLRSITSMGRAAGLIPLFSTQRPSHDIVNTKLRDLPTHRMALRCMTTSASDMILGDGDWSAYGIDASRIPGHERGVGFLRAEDNVPRRIHGYWLDDELVAAIATKATEIRTDAWLAEAGMSQGIEAPE
jgi:S-DNA-T family DNA segregation ATPase FtsK/SpoIIIE